jgi:antitoxin PrlF
MFATLNARIDPVGRNPYSDSMKSVMSEKGQVTIPKPLRDRLGLKAGTVVEFHAENGRLVATKSLAEDVFRKWRGRGRLPGALSVDEYLRVSRGPDAHRR